MSEFTNEHMTPWGYVYDAETLPDFLTVAEFNAYTASKFAGDTRVAANLPSASAAIRNYCGWHISPNLVCGMLYRVLDAKWNEDADDWDGEIITDPDRFDWGVAGLLRIYDAGPRNRKSRIFIKYNAGLNNTAIPDLKELTANLVTHAVRNPYGVNSEAAGGVSVSYSSAWSSGTGSTSLANDTRETLNAYKVKGVF